MNNEKMSVLTDETAKKLLPTILAKGVGTEREIADFCDKLQSSLISTYKNGGGVMSILHKTLDVLKQYPNKVEDFTASDVVTWAHNVFGGEELPYALQNAHRLGSFLHKYPSIAEERAGIILYKTYGNRAIYRMI